MEQYLSVIGCHQDQEGPSGPRLSHFQLSRKWLMIASSPQLRIPPGLEDSFSVCTFQSTEAPVFPGQMLPVGVSCVLSRWPCESCIVRQALRSRLLLLGMSDGNREGSTYVQSRQERSVQPTVFHVLPNETKTCPCVGYLGKSVACTRMQIPHSGLTR